MYLTKEREVRNMAKLKGEKKLNKELTTAFKDFGVDMVMTDSYQYSMTDEEVGFCLLEGRLEDDLFNEFVKERFGYKVTNTFMISILHEIGHHYTLEDIYTSDFVCDFCHKEKERIEAALQNTTKRKEIKRLEWEYFSLPDELAATAWAVNYARTHKKKLDKIWLKVQAAITRFYAKNITEED
jgi:hypothetical protein